MNFFNIRLLSTCGQVDDVVIGVNYQETLFAAPVIGHMLSTLQMLRGLTEIDFPVVRFSRFLDT